MAKICSNCHTENRDDAQFCRGCGTSLATAPPAADAGAEAGLTCFECGFVNKPGVRYCAKCGVNLMGSVVVPRSKMHTPAPAAAPAAADYPPPFDPLPVPDVPDPRTAIEYEREEAAESPPAGVGFGMPPAPPAANRTPLWAGLGIAVLVAAGVAWWFLSSSPSAPPSGALPAATEAPAAPVAATPAAPAAVTTPVTPVEAAAAATAADALAASAASAPPAETAPPAAAETPAAPTEADAKRLAAEKRARDKSARDKADREAKAKAALEQREQAAARLKADQEAAARKRAEEQRPRVQPPAPAPVAAAPVPRIRSVADICAGRNAIGRAICESRECGAAEHANEAVCKKVRAAEERRSNPQN